MSYMENAGWMLAINLLLLIVGAGVGRFTAQKNDCSKCGIARLCNLVRVLCEKAGVPVKEQLQIESLEAGKQGG
jgi:hypothetical protein